MNIKESLMTKILAKPKTAQSSIPLDEPEEEFIVPVGKPMHYCVGIVDIVNSTKTVARLPQNKSSRYYEIFLNSMAKIIRQYKGQVLKTMGDSLLFYFPDTGNSKRKFGFLCSLECGLEMISVHETLKESLAQEMLPQIDFRISFDYGNVTTLKNTDWSLDLVGPTINTCAKINGQCPVNGMVIGSDLYEKTKNFKEYKFKNNGNFSVDLKQLYPIFTVIRNE
jgi:class 3 adenylate cyclase